MRGWVRMAGTVCLLIAAGRGESVAPASPRFDVVVLPTLGGKEALPEALNSRGDVVGYSETTDGAKRATLWENGRPRDLGTLGGKNSHAYGINDKGQVVGRAETKSGTTHAFLWEKGTMRDLGTLGGAVSAAYGINDRGEVVGGAVTKNDGMHPFMYRNGMMRDIGHKRNSGATNVASGINNRGDICGSQDHGAELWRGGRRIELGVLDIAGRSYALGLNNRGDVVGISNAAFLYTNGTLYNLNLCLNPHTLDTGTNEHDRKRVPLVRAKAINDRGQIAVEAEKDGLATAVLLNPAKTEGTR